MIQIQFSVEEIEKLNFERYNHPHPKVQKKMEALYLKSQALPHNEICRLCHISESTLTIYEDCLLFPHMIHRISQTKGSEQYCITPYARCHA
jgi:hypothetical protein